MKILVAGNIASGKSTIIREALKDYPCIKVVAIDDLRAKYGDHTERGEDQARGAFIRDIVLSDNCIIECCGVGKLYSLIKPQLTHMVLVHTDRHKCLARYIERGTDSIIPKEWFKNWEIQDSLHHMDRCHRVTRYDITMPGTNKTLAVKQLKRFINRHL